jgi:Mg2+/Co2+ transporter CorC
MNVKHINESSIQENMVKALPVFKGYTVDIRLQEFRKADRKTGIEILKFGSPQGDDLLEEYVGELDKDSAEFQELAEYLLTRG